MGTFDPKTRSFRKISHWYKKGVSDILGIYKGKFLAIEVKTPTGRASPFQKTFLKDVTDCGGIGFIARSIEDVEENLKKQEIANDHDNGSVS